MAMSLGDHIRKLRVQKGWSREDLAERVGVSHWTIAKYETGDRMPSRDILVKLSEIFGVGIDDLLGGESETSPTLSPEDVTLAQKIAALEPDQRTRVEVFVETILLESKLGPEGRKHLRDFLNLSFEKHKKNTEDES